MKDRSAQERVVVDVNDSEQYLVRVKGAIAHGRARTRNVVAVAIVVAFVLSWPLFLCASIIWPEGAERSAGQFDNWLLVLGPLAGAAVGVGVSETAARRDISEVADG